MGRLRIDLPPRRDGNDEAAAVTVTILTEPRPIELRGITVREPRHGWVTLDVPPLEAWAEPLRWLTPPERERIESAEFYQLIQRHVSHRFLAWKAAAG